MELAIVFIVVSTAWLVFRKWIARQQYRIVTSMLGLNPSDDAGRVKALEQVGTLFCTATSPRIVRTDRWLTGRNRPGFERPDSGISSSYSLVNLPATIASLGGSRR